MTSTPTVRPIPVDDPTAGPDPAAAIAGLLDLEPLLAEIAHLEAVEDAIRDAMARHPGAADRIFHSLPLLAPTHTVMRNPVFHLPHVHELLARVAAGEDTRPATNVEICITMSKLSAAAPLTSSAIGLYFRAWTLAGLPDEANIAEMRRHHEAVESSLIDDHEAACRRRIKVRTRVLAEVTCDGRHYGKAVDCRYVDNGVPPTPRTES